MRLFYFYLFISLVFFPFSQTALAVVLVSPTSVCAINTTLSVGSTGEQVKCLQRAVAVTVDGHFGPLTKASVVAFQLKNKLLPDGIVGPLTQAALGRVVASDGVYLPGCNGTTGYSITTGTKCDSNLSPETPGSLASGVSSNINNNPGTSGVIINSTNPNLKNIDAHIVLVEKAVLKGGLSPDKLPLVEEKIRKNAELSIDFRKEFFDLQTVIYNKNKQISENLQKRPMLAFMSKAVSFFNNVLYPQKAFAAGNLPFGGFVTYVDPEICDCPPLVITLIDVNLPGAEPGISNLALNYVNKTQAFLNFNLPLEDLAVLGMYTPAVPSCWMWIGEACSLVETDGQITPEVGSSLHP